MITEDYVSLEVAELLKEKGFDEYCRFVYNAGVLRSVASLDCHWNEGYGELIEEKQNSDFGKYDNAISAPTLQMAMKWLREEYNLNICFIPSEIEWRAYIFNKDCEPLPINAICGNTYEEACEAVIRYILENLI